MLDLYPEMLENPVVLSNAAWLYVHQQQPQKALELLEKAEAHGAECPKDTVYIRCNVVVVCVQVGWVHAAIDCIVPLSSSSALWYFLSRRSQCTRLGFLFRCGYRPSVNWRMQFDLCVFP